MKKNTVTIRVDDDFKKFLEEVSRTRMELRLDRNQLKTPRLSKALTRVPNLKEFLIKAQIQQRK